MDGNDFLRQYHPVYQPPDHVPGVGKMVRRIMRWGTYAVFAAALFAWWPI